MKLTIFFLSFFLVLTVATTCSAQFKFVDSCVNFTLNLSIENPYSDTIVYSYRDCDKGEGVRGRVSANNGVIQIKGYVNRAAEIMIYTNPLAPYEDSSFYRFIAEHGEHTVKLTMNDDAITNDEILGAKSQLDKKNWTEKNAVLLQLDYKYREEFSVLARKRTTLDSVFFQKALNTYENKRSVLNELQLAEGLKFVKNNPDSYFSAALIFRYKRLYDVDTIVKYLKTLSPKVQQSDFGKYAIEDLSKRTNNWKLFAGIFDTAYLRVITNIKNVYDVTLPSIKGKNIELSNYKNKIIVLDFWASWCKPCIAAIPSINKLREEFKNEPVEFIAISVDDNKAAWKNAVEKNKYNGIQLLDSEELTATYYKVLWFPKYVVLDKNGNVITDDAPSPQSGELEKLIRKALEKQ